MLFQLSQWESIDTADLTSEERHILQKLVLWQSSVRSLDEFHTHTQKALSNGWNRSGPVPRSRNLDRILAAMEANIIRRLKQENS